MKPRQKGSSMIEFALASVFLVPLFIGMIWGGISLGRTIQVTQIARDAGHMYAKNIDFSLIDNQKIIERLSIGANMNVTTPNTGNMVVVLSQIQRIFDQDCLDAGIPLNQCTNNGQTVFLHRIVMGNQSLRASNFGTPAPVAGNGAVSDPLRNVNAVAGNFLPLLNLQRSEVAFVAEGYMDSPDLLGAGRTGVYARSIF